MKAYIHKTSIVDEGVKVGDDTWVWHWCHISARAGIGRGCVLGQNVYVGAGVKIGNEVKIENNVSVFEGVTLEDGVFCGPSSVFTNVLNPRARISRMSEIRPTLVKEGATIGANATIVCGITIGRHAMIGAGSVVTKDVPDYALFYGNPAGARRWVCECGQKLMTSRDRRSPSQLDCPSCGKQYRRKKEGGIEEI